MVYVEHLIAIGHHKRHKALLGSRMEYVTPLQPTITNDQQVALTLAIALIILFNYFISIRAESECEQKISIPLNTSNEILY